MDNCSVFSRKAKRIPAYWVNYFLALRFIISSQSITDVIDAGMAKMKLSRGVWKLTQNILFAGEGINVFIIDL